MFGCAVLTGVGAVVNTARVQAGAVGGGDRPGRRRPVARCWVRVAAGAREIIAIDLADDKLAFARELGATATFNAKDPDAAEQISSATGGGVEFAFELAGSVQGPRARLQDHPSRRHHGDRRPAAADGHHAAAAGQPGGRGADAQGQLYRHRRALPRHSPLHPALPARPAAGRPADERDLDLDEINLGFDRLHDGSAIRQVVAL